MSTVRQAPVIMARHADRVARRRDYAVLHSRILDRSAGAGGRKPFREVRPEERAQTARCLAWTRRFRDTVTPMESQRESRDVKKIAPAVYLDRMTKRLYCDDTIRRIPAVRSLGRRTKTTTEEYCVKESGRLGNLEVLGSRDTRGGRRVRLWTVRRAAERRLPHVPLPSLEPRRDVSVFLVRLAYLQPFVLTPHVLVKRGGIVLGVLQLDTLIPSATERRAVHIARHIARPGVE